MKRTTYLTAIMAMPLAACSFMPERIEPPLPVADGWPDGTQTSQSEAAQLDWKAFFVAPELQGLISQALDSNRDLRIAIGRVEEARGRYNIQRADLYPEAAFGGDYARSRTSEDIAFAGQQLTTNQFSASVNAGWEIDLWGRVRSLNAAALQDWLATDEARQAVGLSVVKEVANIWLVLRELDERIIIAQRTVDSRRESVRIARRRFEVGAAPKFDLTQAETLLTQAENQILLLRQQRDQAQNALVLLVGQPIDLEVRPLSDVEAAVVRDIPPGLPSQLLANRPDIRAAEHGLRATEANIGAARAAFFPRIALTGEFGTASRALDGLLSGGSETWFISPSISLPIFDGGRRRANLAVSKAQRDIAIAQYEQSIQIAFRDVADALAARRWLTEQIAVQQRALSSAQERARLSELRYRNGAAAYIEVLDAERDLFAAEQILVETRRALLTSEVGLYAALGGGNNSSFGLTQSDRDNSRQDQ